MSEKIALILSPICNRQLSQDLAAACVAAGIIPDETVDEVYDGSSTNAVTEYGPRSVPCLIGMTVTGGVTTLIHEANTVEAVATFETDFLAKLE